MKIFLSWMQILFIFYKSKGHLQFQCSLTSCNDMMPLTVSSFLKYSLFCWNLWQFSSFFLFTSALPQPLLWASLLGVCFAWAPFFIFFFFFPHPVLDPIHSHDFIAACCSSLYSSPDVQATFSISSLSMSFLPSISDFQSLIQHFFCPLTLNLLNFCIPYCEEVDEAWN